MRKDYVKPSINILTIEPIKPLAGSGRITSTWIPWRMYTHWDEDGQGAWAENRSWEHMEYPYVRSDDAVKNLNPGEWYYTLEIIDH